MKIMVNYLAEKLKICCKVLEVDVAEDKESPEDFVLWKPAKETDDDSSNLTVPGD